MATKGCKPDCRRGKAGRSGAGLETGRELQGRARVSGRGSAAPSHCALAVLSKAGRGNALAVPFKTGGAATDEGDAVTSPSMAPLTS